MKGSKRQTQYRGVKVAFVADPERRVDKTVNRQDSQESHQDECMATLNLASNLKNTHEQPEVQQQPRHTVLNSKEEKLVVRMHTRNAAHDWIGINPLGQNSITAGAMPKNWLIPIKVP